MRNEKGRTQSIIRRIALFLTCTMLMGQTTWAQAADVEPEKELEESVRENPMAEMEKMAESTMEENDAVAVDKKGDEIPEGLEMAGGAEITGEADVAKETEGMGEIDGKSEDVETAEQYRDSMVEEGTEIDTERIAICKDYPIIIRDWLENWDAEAYRIESADESVCKFTATVDDHSGYGFMYLTLNGVNTGETVIYVKNNDVIVKQYVITVNPLPEDAVAFPDIVLRSYLVDRYGYDQNQDGCIDKKEIKDVSYIDIEGTNLFGFGSSVKDLTGLEYAVNLRDIDLSYNSELTDLSVLFELDSLQRVDLTGTNVSDEDRWKLADFQDTELPKGDEIFLPALHNIFDDDLQVEIISGAECVDMTEPGTNGEMAYSLLAKKEGKMDLKIQYHELETEVSLTITGIPAEQEIGEKYDVEVLPINNQYIDADLSDTSLILDSSHRLWQTYPVAQKIGDNVQDYVSSWVYYGDKDVSERYSYLLDMDNVLWDGTSKLAEDVVRFDGRYALDKNGTLHNIYNTGAEQVEGVEAWISPEYGDEGMVYLLKQDGTLWKRLETVSDQMPREWEFVERDIRQILRSNDGYVWLKTDGTIISDKGIVMEMDAKVSKMCSYEANYFHGDDYFYGDYYDLEGYYYVPCFWRDGAGEYQEGYRNLGKLSVKRFESYIDSETGDGIVYVLTEDHVVYRYSVKTGEKVEVLTNVAEVEWVYGWENSWTYYLMDGTYCDWDGNPMSTVSTDWLDDYMLVQYSDSSQILEKNGVPILSSVTDIWYDWGQKELRYYALRTDGTVWDVTGVPVQVLNLKETGYETGDLNNDNTVNLLDLMLCLNHVSKKNELTGNAFAAADVNGDGKVDLIDLMRILNYVSKKTTEL